MYNKSIKDKEKKVSLFDFILYVNSMCKALNTAQVERKQKETKFNLYTQPKDLLNLYSFASEIAQAKNWNHLNKLT